MDGQRFDTLTRALASSRSRRGFLAALAASVAAAWTGVGTSAKPKADKPSKCYGGGSQCTKGKQCCSGTCTNRRCAPEVPPTFCVAGSTRACYAGPAGTAGVGECRAGLQTCLPDGSGYGPCVGEVVPTDEECDGLDNDCDGEVDNGNPGGGASCTTGLLGICAAGTTACVGGDLICQQNQQPSAEICGNDLDDDCDGSTDEGCCTSDTRLGTPCFVGVGICQRAGVFVCTADEQSVVCNAQVDEDCCQAGYEWNGSECEDIDECSNDLAQCDSVATCINTEGSYICVCPDDYAGDGFHCIRIPEEF